MSESASYSTTLRRSIIGIAHPQILATTWFTTGHDRLDLELGGGLARGRLHEVFTGCPDDMGSASGFAMMLTLRARRPGDRKSTRLNSSHSCATRMPSSA